MSDGSSEVKFLSKVASFDYSFGYDCNQLFNLCVVNETTLIFYSGCLIHIFDVRKRTFEFRRSLNQSGIGHIVKNPSEDQIAVGEKCSNPLIIIYSWPSFDIVSKLSGGTTQAFSHLGYSPDGSMLVSQGKEPDHLITIWDWKAGRIILRVKSHGQDVFNAEFSQFVPGQLTTSGLGHIKFWKMAKTFTGLKLQGELGRFGKTEICDILGMCAMPDGKVISGSEWGNLLVWEDRLIKLEVKQKARGNCHSAPISQIHYNPVAEDVISVGMDGWVKIWTRATIDAADPPDDDSWYLEMQPLLELEVKDVFSHARLKSICKKNSDPLDHDWFGQDAGGGIWSLNLSPEGRPPERLFTCHAGAVADMAPSPVGYYVASLGIDGSLLVHDVVRKELLISKRFSARGTSLLWMPVHVEASGAVLAGGFEDGMVRVFVLSLSELQRARHLSNSRSQTDYVNMIQMVKAHSGAVTAISLNPRGSVLVSGSRDGTFFIYQILPKREYIVLVPIGFVELPAPVSCVTWRPNQNSTAIVACADGTVHQMVLPERPTSDADTTYRLQLSLESLAFRSVKSELIRAAELRTIELEKSAKLERKRAELAKIRTNNPNLDINEELFLMDSDEEAEYPPLFYPATPSPILFLMVLPNDNLLLSMGAFDCGFLYEYNFEAAGPVQSYPIPDALDVPIHCFTFICDGQVLALGLENGVVRLVHCEHGAPNLTDYHDLSMHDTEQGAVRCLAASCDGAYLYSCGDDGNIFSYKVNPSGFRSPGASAPVSRVSSIYVSASIPRDVVTDVSGENVPSLEQTKKDAERLQQLRLAEERKQKVRLKLAKLKEQFDIILERNAELPASQVLPHSFFELDERITAARRDKMDADMALTLRKLAFPVAKARQLVKKMQNHFVDGIASLDVTVRAIKNEVLRVKAFTHNKLTPEFLQAEADMNEEAVKKSVISQMTVDTSLHSGSSIIPTDRPSGMESTLRMQPYYDRLPLKARKLLIKCDMQRLKKECRQQQWQSFLESKPNINADDPFDIIRLEQALKTIGDFKLKASDTYRVPDEKRVTPAQKYSQMLCLHKEIFNTKKAFNEKVCHVRDSKISLVRRFKQLYHDLDETQRELRPELRRERLPVPKCYLKNNFPEHIFRVEFGADPQIYDPVSFPYDKEYFVLRLDREEPAPTVIDCASLMYWRPSLPVEQLMYLARDDDKETPWEYEMRVRRMIRSLSNQDQIIGEMQSGVDKFDHMLERLSIDRLRYARDIKLMEIHRLTLHQELIVINSYAGREEEITSRINTAVAVHNEKMQQKIMIQEQMDSKQSDVQMVQLRLANLQEEVAGKLANNRFATFLNRLFKKKRMAKRSEDSDTESSDADDESDEDYDEDDDENVILMKLDDNVCPEGCEEDLFRDIVGSRCLKYDMEDCITELHKQLYDHQKELQVCNKELAELKVAVQETTKELDTLQFEKQQKLNDIETVVVLNLSQFRHFRSAARPEDGLVQNPLVFHSPALSKLTGRVQELESETDQELENLRHEKTRMKRLDNQLKEMRKAKAATRNAIEEEIVKKFGDLIDIKTIKEKALQKVVKEAGHDVKREEMDIGDLIDFDAIEDAVLKRMVAQCRLDYRREQVRKKYDKVVAEEKRKLQERKDALLHVMKENTRRLQLQTMLEQEVQRLQHLKSGQAANKDKAVGVLADLGMHEKDVKRLEAVLKDQLELNRQLKVEIRQLTYKCSPPEGRKPERKREPSSESLRNAQGGGDMVVESDERAVEVAEEELSTAGPLFAVEPNDVETTGVEMSSEAVRIIDYALQRLASGSSACDVAQSVVEDLISFPIKDEMESSSAFQCATKLVEELVQITTEDRGDVEQVEQLAKQLVKISREENLDVVNLVHNFTDE